MRQFAAETFPVEVSNQGVEGPGVHLPLGAKIVDVAADVEDSLSVMALAPVGAPRVWHPLVILPLGMGIEVPLGRTIGEPLGYVTYGNTCAVVAPLLPWPTSSLLDAPAAGQG